MKRYEIVGNLFENSLWIKDDSSVDKEGYSFLPYVKFRCWMLNRQEAKWKERIGRMVYWYYEVKDTKTDKIVYPGKGE